MCRPYKNRKRKTKQAYQTLWMNSDGQRANILNDNFNGMAAGVYYDAATGHSFSGGNCTTCGAEDPTEESARETAPAPDRESIRPAEEAPATE